MEASNYASPKYKLDMLRDISTAKNLLEDKTTGTLKQEINKKFMEVLDQPNIVNKFCHSFISS